MKISPSLRGAKRRSNLLAAALLLSACTADEPSTPIVDENTAIDTITQDALAAHIAYLADDAREGRMAGQKGYDEAAQYVADRFAERILRRFRL